MQRNISQSGFGFFVAIVFLFIRKTTSAFYYISRVVIYASKTSWEYRYTCTPLGLIFQQKKFTAFVSMDRLLCLAATHMLPEGLGVKMVAII
jgi:hypothetical protein